MRSSAKILLIATGTVLLIMLMVMILGRIAIGWDFVPESVSRNNGIRKTSHRQDDDRRESMSPDFKDFDEILIDGAWSVQLHKSTGYSIDISYPKSMSDEISVRTEGRTLVLSCLMQDCSDSGPEAFIGMPLLSGVNMTGSGEINLSGFHEESMNLEIGGAAGVVAEDSSVENIFIRLDGIGHVDLTEMPVKNARVDLDGAGGVRLFMDGGVLEGGISGWGRITYTGEVSEERVSISGRGSVKRR